MPTSYRQLQQKTLNINNPQKQHTAMKNLFWAIIATMTLSTTAAMAQDENAGQRPQFDRNEMVKHQTEQIVKQYGLNEEQAAKLLDLNTRYAEKMMPMGGRRFDPNGRRPEGMRPNGRRPEGMRPNGRISRRDSLQAPRADRRADGRLHRQGNDSLRGPRDGMRPDGRIQRQGNDSLRGQRGGMRPDGRGFSEDMRKQQEAYEEELKAILTPEQYEAWKKDQQNRRRH